MEKQTDLRARFLEAAREFSEARLLDERSGGLNIDNLVLRATATERVNQILDEYLALTVEVTPLKP